MSRQARAPTDWPRSLFSLALAFVTVAVITLGVAKVVVPATPQVGSQGPASGDGGDVPGVGGDLVLRGDREATVAIRPSGPGGIVGPVFAEGERFSLTGDGLRISFEADPIKVAQISYDGLEFFPNESACMVTPRGSESEAAIGMVELSCDELRDVRGNGVIGLAGEIGLPTGLLVERTLPYSGGRVTVGDELWEFDEVTAFTSDSGDGESTQYSITSFSGFDVRSLDFAYESDSGGIRLLRVERDGTVEDVPEEACDVSREELGEHVQVLVTELVIQCQSIEVPGLGAVPIEGAVIVDEARFADQRGH